MHPTTITSGPAAETPLSSSQKSNPQINEHTTTTTRSIDTVSVNEKTIIEERYDNLSNVEHEAGSDRDTINYDTDDKKLDTGEDFEETNYGWLIVLGAFMVQVTSFGTATSWGVMQSYFHNTNFGISPDETNPQVLNQQLLNLSFVGTMALIFTNICGPLAQILTSVWGHQIVLALGTLCVTLGLILAGFAHEIWHLYLTQGILFGIGASLMYCTIMSVAPLWFNKRRGLALGVVASGSGIGGLIIPFIMEPINRTLGPAWTYRVLGFICLACDLVAVVFVKPRVPVPRQRKKLSDIIQLKVLKDINFLLFCIGSMVVLLGYFIPYFFLPDYAKEIHLDPAQGAALVSASSAMNFVGRILAGICADRIGKVNTNIIFTVIGGLSSLLIWTFAKTYGVLMAYAVIFGLFCGSYFALLSPITAHLLGFERFPTGLSVMLISNVISVFGPNIATAIGNAVDAEPFFAYKIFAGVAYLVGACILFALKIRLDRKLFAKV